jgi:putative DNA methylase
MTAVKTRKKLVEVALPLEAINKASVREGYIYRGNPSALHKWWAQRPLAAARAVIFAQMVDDPSTYVSTLLHVPERRRAAEREQKKRHALWETRKAAFEAATGAEAVAVPEPGPEPTLEDCAADIERQRLFRIIEQLVLWENTTNEAVLEQARAEIWQSWRRACADNAGHPRAAELFDRAKLPAFYDPFAGGGALPLEAQRLGLEAYASDLNPVAVLINKAMIEIPPKFAGRSPANPISRKEAEHGALRAWNGTQGLAEDVRYYGKWMRDEAQRRIGHLYPQIEITADMVAERPDLKPYSGCKLNVIAWLWARTVKSPNPAFRDVHVPLASTFMLSTKTGKEAYVEPAIDNGAYFLKVKLGRPDEAEAEVVRLGTSVGKRKGFRCLMSNIPMPYEHIRTEARAGRMGSRLLAIVAEGTRGRIYLNPTKEHEAAAQAARPIWRPDCEFPKKHRNFQGPAYGLENLGDIFTGRQLVTMATLSELVGEALKQVEMDIVGVDDIQDDKGIAGDGRGARAYAECIATYLSFILSKTLDYNCSLVPWYTKEDRPGHLFSKQAIPMVWDFAEMNPLGSIGGTFLSGSEIVAGSLAGCAASGTPAHVAQDDAIQTSFKLLTVVSTDPPYYDNIAYADLSDFFYVWLRHSIRPIFPDLFATLAVPKAEELVATPGRHGGKEKAETFFLDGMTRAMHRLVQQTHPSFPATIYYAFKQSETDISDGTTSTGWETFLDAVIKAGFALSGTWPIRTERGSRSVGIGANALASSIVLVCRPRIETASIATRREFLNALKAELPEAFRQLQRGNIAPVDLAQASIGPGMAVQGCSTLII